MIELGADQLNAIRIFQDALTKVPDDPDLMNKARTALSRLPDAVVIDLGDAACAIIALAMERTEARKPTATSTRGPGT